MVMSEHHAAGHMHWNVIVFDSASVAFMSTLRGWSGFQTLLTLSCRRMLFHDCFAMSLMRAAGIPLASIDVDVGVHAQ